MTFTPLAEYQRAREMFAFCVEDGHKDPLLALMGAGDNYSELQILEEEMLETVEGLS